MLDAGSLEDCAIGLDSGSNEGDFETAKKHNPNVPIFSSETYPGWLTHWFEKWQRPNAESLKKEMTFLLKNKKSFSLYVVHGGTNFGFSAGANAFSPTQYQPDVTSYDYDAPINENGEATPKYYMLRNLIQEYVPNKLPEVPAAIKKIAIPAFTLKATNSIWSNLTTPIKSPATPPAVNKTRPEGFGSGDN